MLKETKSMPIYVLQRLMQTIPLLIVIIIFAFALGHLTGDPIVALAGDFPLPEEKIQHLREVYGLDKSIPEQLWAYFSRIVRGDLGFSFRQHLPVSTLILERLGASFLLGAAAMLASSALGIAFGILASLRPRSLLDNLIVMLSVTGFSIPNFWVAQMSIILFSVHLGWLPGVGMRSVDLGTDVGLWSTLIDYGKHLVLPTLVLATSSMGVIARVTRANMIEVMHKDFITTARMKGLSEYAVKIRHVFRNSLIVVVTMIGMNAGAFIFGTVLVETIFAWPGIGRLAFTSIMYRDFPVVMGVFIFATVLVVVINLITDILYAYLDPRIRY